MFCKLVRSLGLLCEFHEVENGLEAVEKIKVTPNIYDAVFLDSVMPIMDGPEAAKEMRRLGFSGPIFGLTGNAMESQIEHFLLCGVDRVFTKPINVDEVSNAIVCLPEKAIAGSQIF